MKKAFRILALIQKLNPYAIVSVFMFQVTTLASPFMMLYFTAQIVNQIINQASLSEILPTLFIFLGVKYLLALLNNIFRCMNDVNIADVGYKLNDQLTKKALVMDYQQLASPENRLNFQRAEEGSNFSGGILTFISNVVGFTFGVMISIAVAGVALINVILTRSSETTPLATFTNSWVFPVILLASILIPLVLAVLANRKAAMFQKASFEIVTHSNREMGYYYSTLLTNNDVGKTIRLYNAADLIIGVVGEGGQLLIDTYLKSNLDGSRYVGLSQMVTTMGTAVIYLLIGAKASVGVISIGSVLMYVGYTQTLINNLVEGLGKFTFAQNIINYLQYYVDFLDLPDTQSGIQQLPQAERLVFKFEDVSFTYPGSETPVLDHVTLTISDQERIAIVGKNGAGKTTFIKLLCKLYQPTSGRITLNGIDINSFDNEAYMRLLSVVFQDFNLYPFEIDANISLGSDYYENRVLQSLDVVGVADKVKKLEKGIHTTIKGQLDEGVDLSGGEAQKIAIARAWYKDSPFVILDEPTAALDPISEYEIYQNFDALMEGKTAIYVSHRMSSCKFCDRVLVFDQGRIVQDGAHDELIDDESAIYAELFNAQAQYYIS